jgi:hypothetical protein
VISSKAFLLVFSSMHVHLFVFVAVVYCIIWFCILGVLFLYPVVITRLYYLLCLFDINQIVWKMLVAGVGIGLNQGMVSICILVKNNTWHSSTAFCTRVRMLDSSLHWTRAVVFGYNVTKSLFQLQTSIKCLQFLLTVNRFNSYNKEPVFENFSWDVKTFSHIDIYNECTWDEPVPT